MYPDWGLNQHPCGIQDDGPSNGATWPEQGFPCFLRLSNIPLHVCTTASLSIHPLMGTARKLFPCLGCYKQCCYEHEGADIFSRGKTVLSRSILLTRGPRYHRKKKRVHSSSLKERYGAKDFTSFWTPQIRTSSKTIIELNNAGL